RGRGAPDSSGRAAGPTVRDGKTQPPVDGGDPPRHEGYDTSEWPARGAETARWAGQSQPTDDHADQRQHNDRGGPESPEGQAVNCSSGWFRNVGGHQHGMHKPSEQGGGSQDGENKSECSFQPSIPARLVYPVPASPSGHVAPPFSNGETG